jgi:pimeloyl-ACP methyl ester carboxylesterase
MYAFYSNGHTLTWKEYSSGEHIFVFLHGWSVGRLTWEPIIPMFTSLGRCIAIDLPGHYPAQTPPDFHSMTQEQLIDLEALAIEHICGNFPVTLIGHSAGGLVALGVAARLPHLIKRIVSLNSVVWGDFTGIVGTAQWLLRNGLYSVFESFWTLTLQNTLTMMAGLSFFVHQQDAFWTSQRTWNVCRDASQWYRLHSLPALAVLLDTLDTCDVRPLVSSLSLPVLVITGENDPVVPPEQSYWLIDHLPGSELRVFEHTGHIPQLEAPIAFGHVVRDWLTTCDGV